MTMPNLPATALQTTTPASPPQSGHFTIQGKRHAIVDMPNPPDWARIAQAKGFDLLARIRDHHHLALRCHACGGVNKVKAYTLRSARPQCQHCLESRWRASAQAAGATLLHRCPQSHKHVFLRLGCGHVVRRQMGLVTRVARGEVGFRCETCHSAREADEASARGWRLIGPDPEGEANYRLYAHACGHQQRVARANLRTGRFLCGGCGQAWPAAPSALYLMRFTLPDARVLIKLGMSRDPQSRLRHQLLRHDGVEAELLAHLPMARGQLALKLERRIHKHLRQHFPKQVVPRAVFERHLKVGSEIYEPVLEAPLRALFARIAGKATAA